MSTKSIEDTTIDEKKEQMMNSDTTEYRTGLESLVHEFKQDILGLISLIVLSVIILITIFGPIIWSLDPAAQNYQAVRQAPSWGYYFGTDHIGRDVFARVIVGGRYSLMVGFFSIIIASSAGIFVGGLAGYTSREWLDETLMRSMDILISFPAIVMGIAVMGIFGADPIDIGPTTIGNLEKLIVIIGIIYTPRFARLTRGAVMKEKGKSYVRMSRIEGAPHSHIFTREIFPNILSPILVMFTYRIGSAMIVAAALSFLGIGIQPPTPSWGNILSDSRDLIFIGVWWVTIFPGIALAATIMCLNIVGDSVRDALDPEVSIMEE